jgi:hypothetical protein
MEEKTNESIPQEGDFKVKKKPKKLTKKTNENPKMDFSKIKENTETVETKEEKTEEVTPTEEIKVEEVASENLENKPIEGNSKEEEEDITVISEVASDVEINEEPVVENTNINVPENLEKLISFMNETGGDINDYVRLNADYSNVDEDTLLREYYKNTKPHLDKSEIEFLMEEQFKVDEDYDEERAVRKKRLAKKEEVAKASKFLENLKKQYYDEIKLRPTVNNEMTKANEFFSNFKKDQKIAEQKHNKFKVDTNKYFSEEFKGFDFALGERKFRYSVSNPSDVANAQSNISNVVKKFLNEDGEVVDIKGYHKAMYAARNADTIAQHFYEQGKADAVKDVVAKSKNINNEVRKSAPEDVYLNGFKVKAVSGVNSSKLKIKRK